MVVTLFQNSPWWWNQNPNVRAIDPNQLEIAQTFINNEKTAILISQYFVDLSEKTYIYSVHLYIYTVINVIVLCVLLFISLIWFVNKYYYLRLNDFCMFTYVWRENLQWANSVKLETYKSHMQFKVYSEMFLVFCVTTLRRQNDIFISQIKFWSFPQKFQHADDMVLKVFICR